MCVAYGDVEGSSALSNMSWPFQYVMAFILGDGHLNSEVNVSRILMTIMNPKTDLFHFIQSYVVYH